MVTGIRSADRMPVITGILAIPYFMSLDAGHRRRLGQIMAQEEQAAPAVLKTGVFTLQPVPPASPG